MTKQEILQDIDKLCGDIDKWLHMKADALDEAALDFYTNLKSEKL